MMIALCHYSFFLMDARHHPNSLLLVMLIPHSQMAPVVVSAVDAAVLLSIVSVAFLQGTSESVPEMIPETFALALTWALA